MRKEITMGSLFDGISGFPLAAVRNGIKPIWASEIEVFPIAVSRQQFPDMQHLGDIKQLNGNKIPSVDIVAGGSPCQDLSVAGKRKGLSGDRSVLFLEQIRIIKEMRDFDIRSGRKGKDVRPRFMAWENVPGVFSTSTGEDFRQVLENICKIADETVVIPRPHKNKWFGAGFIMGENFSVAWRVLDAQYWGVPQRRKRIFLVADFGGQCAPEILFEPCRLHGNTQEGKIEGENAARGARESASKTMRENVNVMPFDTGFMFLKDHKIASDFGDVCHTLSASAHIPKILVQNCYCISGQVLERNPKNGGRGMGVKENISYGLNTSDRHAVYCVATQQSNAEILNDLSPTITAYTGMSGNNQPWILENHKSFSEQTYSAWRNSNIASTIKASGGFLGGGSENLTLSEDVVRKLTPLECERLQGFPDYWTKLKFREDFSDEEFNFWKSIYIQKKKVKKDPTKQQILNWYNKLCTDNARYKALGNSIAIPCVEFVMGRIKEIGYLN